MVAYTNSFVRGDVGSRRQGLRKVRRGGATALHTRCLRLVDLDLPVVCSLPAGVTLVNASTSRYDPADDMTGCFKGPYAQRHSIS